MDNKILLDNDSLDCCTVLHIQSAVCRGLLMKISNELYSLGVVVESCEAGRDQTDRSQYNLVVHITNEDGSKILDRQFIDQIIQRLKKLLRALNQSARITQIKSVTASSSPKASSASEDNFMQADQQVTEPIVNSTEKNRPNVGRLWRLSVQLARLKGLVKSNKSYRHGRTQSLDDLATQNTPQIVEEEGGEKGDSAPMQGPKMSPFAQVTQQNSSFNQRSNSLPGSLGYGPVKSPFSVLQEDGSDDDDEEEKEDQENDEGEVRRLQDEYDFEANEDEEDDLVEESSNQDRQLIQLNNQKEERNRSVKSPLDPKMLPLVQKPSFARSNSSESSESVVSTSEHEWSIQGQRHFSKAQESNNECANKSNSVPAFKGSHCVKVDEVMSQPVLDIHQCCDWHEAIHKMKQFGVSSLLVDTDEEEKGFVTKRTLIRLWSKLNEDNKQPVTVKDVMVRPVIYVELGTMLNQVSDIMEREGIRRVLVRDEKGKFVGIVSDTDIFRALKEDSNIYSVLKPDHLSSNVKQLSDRYQSMDFRSKAASFWEVDINQVNFVCKIGQGSFGEVWMGKWRGIEVAVKRLFQPSEKEGSISEESLQDFEREVGYMAMVRHPNIVQFLGVSHMGGSIALLLEFCPLGSLDRVLHKSTLKLSLGVRLKMALNTARGMNFLHSQTPPLVHNDLKTANLLVSSNFVVKIADFGLSRTIRQGTALPVGTAQYTAPEILQGNSEYSTSADIWSFGIVLWELIMRERPYEDVGNPLRLVAGIIDHEIRVPPIPPECCTPQLSDLVEQCLQWDQRKRPNFEHILEVLESEFRLLRNRGVVSRDLNSQKSRRAGQVILSTISPDGEIL